MKVHTTVTNLGSIKKVLKTQIFETCFCAIYTLKGTSFWKYNFDNSSK